MALGTLLSAVAAPVIGAAASKLFGGGSSASSALGRTPVANITAGGLSSSRSNRGGVSITSSAERQGLIGTIAKTFPEQAALLQKLRMSVAPGMSGLRTSRLQEIENARRSAVGDLRDTLSRRRVLGSSFAADALTRANLSFAEQADKVAAESFMQELDLTQQLTQQEFEARRGEFTTQIDEMNLQADLAQKLAGAATEQMGANARLKADLDAKEATASGTFFGQIGSKIAGALNFGGTPAISSAGAGIWQG